MKSTNALLVLLFISIYHHSKSSETILVNNTSEAEDIQLKESKCPKKTTSKVCNPEDIFNKGFEHEVRKYYELKKMFDIGSKVSPLEYKAGTFYLAVAFAVDAGASNDSLDDAISVTRNMPSNSQKLVSDTIVSVYAGCMSKFLAIRKVLNCPNARKLAKVFAQQMKDTYLTVVHESYPRSKVTALPVGAGKFLSALTPLDQDAATTLSGVIEEVWKHHQDIGAIPDADRTTPPVRRAITNPLLKPNQKACSSSRPVQKFFMAYLDYLIPSETLSDMVTLQAPVEFSRATFYIGHYLMQGLGVRNNAILADFMSMYVKNEWGLEPSTLTFVHGNFIAKFLESQLILNLSNAAMLGRLYAKTLEEAADKIAHSESSRSKIVALGYGIKNFLIELKIFEAYRGEPFAFFYGNEWFCLSLHRFYPSYGAKPLFWNKNRGT